MKEIMRNAMEHGALGVSFSLIYVPGCYTKTDELIEIAKIVGEYHGVAAIHLRSEGNKLVSAAEEFIQIVRQSGVRGVISHHKAAGLSENWGKVHTTLRMLDQANAEGLELLVAFADYSIRFAFLTSEDILNIFHIIKNWGHYSTFLLWNNCTTIMIF